MDPDANLREQLELTTRILSEEEDRTIGDLADQAVRLAELVKSLNDWISSGGFLPEPWRGPHGL